MLVEQLIRETLELHGFRIESVEKKDSVLLVNIARIFVISHAVGSAVLLVTIVIHCLSATSAMYRYGESA